MKARHGTTWEEAQSPVKMELAKRDIPAKFTPRQQPHHGALIPHHQDLTTRKPTADLLPAKRPRQDDGWGFAGDATAMRYSGSQLARRNGGDDEGPRTLHLGGLPA